jgi:predicted phosphodiesterase
MQGRLWTVSDIHIDYDLNAEFIAEITSPHQAYGLQDALILAGDISHDTDRLGDVFNSLKGTFGQVFFVPGNHELWLRDKSEADMDSFTKFNRILDLCRELDVKITPDLFKSGDLACWIVPLFSWYRSDFARASSAPDILSMDEHYCRWPARIGDPADFFLSLNESALALPKDGHPIISFSHFLPRPDLLPRSQDPAAIALAAFAGDRRLDAQIRRLGSSLHIFGHSHEAREEVCDGIRYLQNSIGYPRERGHLKPALREIRLGDLTSRPLAEFQNQKNYPI